MRVGISGTHATGKTTLAQAMCTPPGRPRDVMADEPYVLLEEEGCKFAFPRALEDYSRALKGTPPRSRRSASLQVINGHRQ